ncbi:MAG: cytochrome C [Verrucomicrobiaceae bacterium]|nr:MAG: cytochrome C [Verrucomicrobiaceae bacterium]
MSSIIAATPVPRDLPLHLPLPEGLLKILLVLFFLVHILFVNLTVGGSLLVSLFEFLGFRNRKFDRLALELAKTVTVNKSLAVVMGIGPLLCINLVYTVQWYGANALTGHAWLLIIPLITFAFLLAYLHKYTWHRWETGAAKKFHWAISLTSSLLFLAIPFVFLANVNLMLFPGEWEKVKGFFSSLTIGNVFPRYFHFLLASVALTGLAGAGWFWRRAVVDHLDNGMSREELRRLFYQIAAGATALQFVAGPILLLTLPSVGVTPLLYKIILPSAVLGLVLLLALLKKLTGPDIHLRSGYIILCVFFSIVVLGMGSGRHAYREASLAAHKEQVRKRSSEYEDALAAWNASNPLSAEPEETPEQLFATCAACHAPDSKLVGPSLREIASIYPGNPGGIVTWAMAPGKKRPDSPQMPSFAHLGEDKLRVIADYILATAPR